MYSTHLCLRLFLCVGVAYVIMIIDNIVMQRHNNEHKRQEDRQTKLTGHLQLLTHFERPRQLTKLSVYCIELIITYALWARPRQQHVEQLSSRARPQRELC